MCSKNDGRDVKAIIADKVYEDQVPRIFCNARHKELCHEIKGKVMKCSECHQEISTVEMINNCLQSWRETTFNSNRTRANQPDTIIPISPKRLDMAAYTFSYHMEGDVLGERIHFGGA